MDKLDRQIVKILKLNIDSTSTKRVLGNIRLKLEKFDKKLGSEAKFLITTPNPEQVMLSGKDSTFAEIINSSDFALADGIGLALAYKFLRLPTTKNFILKPILYFAQGLGVGFSAIFDKDWIYTDGLEIIRGRDFFIELVRLCNKKGWRVFLVGNRERSAQRAKKVLEQSYLSVKFCAEEGPNLDNEGIPVSAEEKLLENKLIEKINKAVPHMLFVGFGAPKQEKWLYRHLRNLNIGGAMVVGGTFDYISGRKKLPPDWISDLGIEWLWRLYIGDQNIKRLVSAFPHFAWKVFITKFKKTPGFSPEMN